MSSVEVDIEIDEQDLLDCGKQTYTYPASNECYFIDSDIKLDTLPDDIFRMILPRLNKADILNLRESSKTLNNKINNNIYDSMMFNASTIKLIEYNTNNKLIRAKDKVKLTKDDRELIYNYGIVNELIDCDITREEMDEFFEKHKYLVKELVDEKKIDLIENKIELPKSSFFGGRMIMRLNLNLTIKQLESTNVSCVGVINMPEINKQIKYYKNIRCISTKRVNNEGIQEMTKLTKLNQLVLNLDLVKKINITRVHKNHNPNSTYHQIINGIIPQPARFSKHINGNTVEYFDIETQDANIGYLNNLPNIKTITLNYTGLHEDNVLNKSNMKITFKEGYKCVVMKYVTKLSIKHHCRTMTNFLYFMARDKVNDIGFNILCMFKNITKLIIKSLLTYEGYFAILLMFKLEELYLSKYDIRYNDQENDNITCVLYEVIKRLKVLSIEKILLEKLYIYTPQNTKYNFFDKFIGNSDGKLGKTISFPSIEKLNIDICNRGHENGSEELPLFPNLKKLSINPHYYNIDKYSNLIKSVDTIIIKPEFVDFNQGYKMKYIYSHEFNNIRDLTIVITDINSIGLVHMFPQISVLRIINPHKERYKLADFMLKFVMYIRCLDYLKDLYLTNIDLKTYVTDTQDIRQFLKTKLSKINIIYNEDVLFSQNEDEIMSYLLMRA